MHRQAERPAILCGGTFGTCPPLFPSPHAHSFAIGPAVTNNNAGVWCWTSNNRVKRPAQRRAPAASAAVTAAPELEVRRPHRSTIARAICPVPNKSLSLSLSISLLQPSSLPRSSIFRSSLSLSQPKSAPGVREDLTFKVYGIINSTSSLSAPLPEFIPVAVTPAAAHEY
jgi:hypothetical protein